MGRSVSSKDALDGNPLDLGLVLADSLEVTCSATALALSALGWTISASMNRSTALALLTRTVLGLATVGWRTFGLTSAALLDGGYRSHVLHLEVLLVLPTHLLAEALLEDILELWEGVELHDLPSDVIVAQSTEELNRHHMVATPLANVGLGGELLQGHVELVDGLSLLLDPLVEVESVPGSMLQGTQVGFQLVQDCFGGLTVVLQVDLALQFNQLKQLHVHPRQQCSKLLLDREVIKRNLVGH